jgi:hypothetical protein
MRASDSIGGDAQRVRVVRERGDQRLDGPDESLMTPDRLGGVIRGRRRPGP